MATAEDVSQVKSRVDDLRDQIAAEKATQLVVDAENAVDYENDMLLAEEARLKAELAAIRGEQPEVVVETVGDWVVPMGTTSVDTDVVQLAPVVDETVVEELVKSNTKDDLVAKAEAAGVDAEGTKTDIATALAAADKTPSTPQGDDNKEN